MGDNTDVNEMHNICSEMWCLIEGILGIVIFASFIGNPFNLLGRAFESAFPAALSGNLAFH